LIIVGTFIILIFKNQGIEICLFILHFKEVKCMGLLALLQKIFGEQQGKEIYDKITANKDVNVLVEDPNKPQYVDKMKYDLVNEQLKDAQNTIKTRDTQIKDLEKLAADPEKIKTLEQTIKDLQIENKNTADTYEKQLKQKDFEYAIEKALGPQVHNVKAVKALLDLEKLTVDKENVIGLKEQLDTLKKSDVYLFKSEPPKQDTTDTLFGGNQSAGTAINLGGTGQIGNPSGGIGVDTKPLSYGARLAQKRIETQKASEAQKNFFS
jgi:hypothetical protein